MSDFEIGTTEGGMTNIEQLTTPLPDPRSSFLPFARTVSLGSGGTRGIGTPVAIWTFGILTVEQYSQLKTFCPDASADIFIHTKIDDDTYATFSGVMIWPNELQDRFLGGHRRNLSVQFRQLIEIPEGS